MAVPFFRCMQSPNCLDAGAHQDRWNPYADIPYEWNHEDRDEESESGLQVGPNYILPNINTDTESNAKLAQAPSITDEKPKPIKRSHAEVDDLDDAAIKRAAKRVGGSWRQSGGNVAVAWRPWRHLAAPDGTFTVPVVKPMIINISPALLTIIVQVGEEVSHEPAALEAIDLFANFTRVYYAKDAGFDKLALQQLREYTASLLGGKDSHPVYRTVFVVGLGTGLEQRNGKSAKFGTVELG
ncbi:hypothetical protein K438DRAFT_1772424 [Mycena galopus ATCC 62051]|nr:hypothetical protein K438DRAFT_1772424 [Mycena galopus ATCC 62051]